MESKSFRTEEEMWAYLREDEMQKEYAKTLVEPEETTLTIPTTLEQKELFKMVVKERVMNGVMNPLEFYRQAKIIADSVEELKKDPDLLDCAQSEIEKYGKEKPTINGAVVTSASRSQPDFTTCGDPVYLELKEKLKEREAFLRNIPAEGTVDPNTGVLIMPPTMKHTNYITVKL